MSDHPILFSTPMIRAIMREVAEPGSGKTQTRRVITPQNFKLRGHDFKFHRPDANSLASAFNGARDFRWIEDAFSWVAAPGSMHPGAIIVDCRGMPLLAPGDRLWVREKWRNEVRWDSAPPREIIPASPIYFEAGGGGEEAIPECAGKLRPSIHMPRWASRLTLYVTDVRVERLQSISEADAQAEGLTFNSWEVEEGDDAEICEGWSADRFIAFNHGVGETAIDGYRLLWNSINGPGAWDNNPWVCAYTFRPVLGNMDSLPEKLPEGA